MSIVIARMVDSIDLMRMGVVLIVPIGAGGSIEQPILPIHDPLTTLDP